jgi:hypothetical protein
MCEMTSFGDFQGWEGVKTVSLFPPYQAVISVASSVSDNFALFSGR